MRYLLIIISIFVGINCAKGQDTIKNEMLTSLNDYTCKPRPDGLLVFYDIDGLIIEAKEIAASKQYCECYTNIEGIDLYDAYKHGKIKYIKPKRHYLEYDIRYLASSDGRTYDLFGKYIETNGLESQYIYWKFKTKMPMVVNDTIYYSVRDKKKAVRRYKYIDLAVSMMDSNEAEKKYGRKGKYGALIVSVK